MGKGIIAGPTWAADTILLNPSGWFFSHLGKLPHVHLLISIIWELQGPSCRSVSDLCANPSSSMLFPVHFGNLVFLDSSLHLLNSGMHCVLPGFPLPLPWSGNSLKTVSWGNCGFTSFAPHCSGIRVLHYLMCNVWKKHYLIYFVQFYCCFRWSLNLVPVTPFWLEMGFFSYFLLAQS